MNSLDTLPPSTQDFSWPRGIPAPVQASVHRQGWTPPACTVHAVYSHWYLKSLASQRPGGRGAGVENGASVPKGEGPRPGSALFGSVILGESPSLEGP